MPSRIITVTPNPSIDLLFEADTLVWDDANRVAMPRRRAGGQGINVTRAVRTLGGESIAVTLLGGNVGDELRSLLAAEGIDVRAACRDAAQREGRDGWKLGLQMPVYLPVQAYAEDRELRAALYRANAVRASELGNDPALDNGALIYRILALRAELAGLLGFEGLRLQAGTEDRPAPQRDRRHKKPEEQREKSRGAAKAVSSVAFSFPHASGRRCLVPQSSRRRGRMRFLAHRSRGTREEG